MSRAGVVAMGAVLFAGCVSPGDERFRAYTDDALALFQQGKYLDARDSFQAALQLQPSDANLQYDVGQCYDRLGDLTKAEQAYRQCLVTAPNHAECRHSLDLLLVRQKRQNEATRLIEDWLARNPKLASPYAEDGWYWRQVGDLPRARARLQQALEIDPRNVRALTELALIYEAMDRPDRALVLYERVLEKEPEQVEFRNRVQYLLAHGAVRPRPE